MVDAFLDALPEALARGDGIELRGFGTFKVRHRKARTGRNPRTGEAVEVPALGCAGVQTVKAPSQPGGARLRRGGRGRTHGGHWQAIDCPLSVAHDATFAVRGSQGAQPPCQPRRDTRSVATGGRLYVDAPR